MVVFRTNIYTYRVDDEQDESGSLLCILEFKQEKFMLNRENESLYCW